MYAQKALSLQQDLPYGNLILGCTYLKQGKYREALEFHQRLPKRDPMLAVLANTYIHLNQRDKAIEIWDEMEKRYQEGAFVHPIGIGMLAAHLGYKDRAIEFLSKAVDEKFYPISYIGQMPGMDAYMDDPRFQNLLKKMNLPVLTKENKSITAKTIPPARLALTNK